MMIVSNLAFIGFNFILNMYELYFFILEQNWIWTLIYLIINFVCLVFIVLLSILVGYHFYFWIRKISTYEYIK